MLSYHMLVCTKMYFGKLGQFRPLDFGHWGSKRRSQSASGGQTDEHCIFARIESFNII